MTYLAMFSLGIQSHSSDTDEGGFQSPPKYIVCKKNPLIRILHQCISLLIAPILSMDTAINSTKYLDLQRGAN